MLILIIFDMNITIKSLLDDISIRGVDFISEIAEILAILESKYDEPSSALDPLAEYQLNKTITELAEDKTVISISHRLSTTRFVDNIYMMENGEIVEQGSHENLMKLDGKYAEMFKLQAEKYR